MGWGSYREGAQGRLKETQGKPITSTKGVDQGVNAQRSPEGEPRKEGPERATRNVRPRHSGTNVAFVCLIIAAVIF